MTTASPLELMPQALPEVVLVQPRLHTDGRGFFTELVRDDLLAEAGIPPCVQENLSRSTRGVLRGLHWQNEPCALGKLVRCARGRVFDVAVDARRGSPTFRRWVGLELDADRPALLWIPPGFAHGFCVVSDVADVVYRQTGYWSPEHERAVRWNDPSLAIAWPVSSPILSAKDAAAPLLDAADVHLGYGEATT